MSDLVAALVVFNCMCIMAVAVSLYMISVEISNLIGLLADQRKEHDNEH